MKSGKTPDSVMCRARLISVRSDVQLVPGPWKGLQSPSSVTTLGGLLTSPILVAALRSQLAPGANTRHVVNADGDDRA